MASAFVPTARCGPAGFLEHIALISDIDEADELSGSVSLLTLHAARAWSSRWFFVVAMEEASPARALAVTTSTRSRRSGGWPTGMTRAQKMLYLSHAFHRTVYGETRRQRLALRSTCPRSCSTGGGAIPTPSSRASSTPGRKYSEQPTGGRQIDVAGICTARGSGPGTRRARFQRRSLPPGRVRASRQPRWGKDAAWKAGEGQCTPGSARGSWSRLSPIGMTGRVTGGFQGGGGVKKLLAGWRSWRS